MHVDGNFIYYKKQIYYYSPIFLILLLTNDVKGTLTISKAKVKNFKTIGMTTVIEHIVTRIIIPFRWEIRTHTTGQRVQSSHEANNKFRQSVGFRIV